MITIGIGVRGVVCPVDLPVRLRVCAVECSQTEEEEGAVDPIRTIDGVVVIGKCSAGKSIERSKSEFRFLHRFSDHKRDRYDGYSRHPPSNYHRDHRDRDRGDRSYKDKRR